MRNESSDSPWLSKNAKVPVRSQLEATSNRLQIARLPVCVAGALESAESMPIRVGRQGYGRPKRAEELIQSLRFDLRGFRVLFWRGPCGDLTSPQAAPAADALQPFHGVVRQAWGSRRSRPELIEPLSAVDRRNHRPRNRNGPGWVGPHSKFQAWARAIRTCTARPFRPVILSPRIGRWRPQPDFRFGRRSRNGYSPAGPPSGTVLGKLLPSSVPITGVYHFTQLADSSLISGRGSHRPSPWRSGMAIASD